jgi:hypothetical protein
LDVPGGGTSLIHFKLQKMVKRITRASELGGISDNTHKRSIPSGGVPQIKRQGQTKILVANLQVGYPSIRI